MKRYEKIYRNWHVHNVLAHPASHILRMLGAHGAAAVGGRLSNER